MKGASNDIELQRTRSVVLVKRILGGIYYQGSHVKSCNFAGAREMQNSTVKFTDRNSICDDESQFYSARIQR